MKIIVVGGTGVFGVRLAELLARDGHDVCLAARDIVRAKAAAKRLTILTGANVAAVRFDRTGDLAALAGKSVVIDAAGPFHGYGDDPYRLPRAAIEHRLTYLDLSDNAAFTAGIEALDDAAKAAGVTVLSGVSSVPALSSAVASAVMDGAEHVAQLDVAILPGNRAARGRSVTQSILAQVGRPFELTIDGTPKPVRGWSQPMRYDLGKGMVRTGHLIEVPDCRLSPTALKVPTVLFRAGLELWPMRAGLALWSRTRWSMPRWMKSAAYVAGQLMRPFGTDKGGMSVEVLGKWSGTPEAPAIWERKWWHLRVIKGDGPYIPGVAARAILRDLQSVRPGARAATSDLTLMGAEAALEGLSAETERGSAPAVPVFQQVLGADFDALPGAVRASHDSPGCRVFVGQADVSRGEGLFSRIIAGLFRFPPAGHNVPVSVTKWANGGASETWERRFGDRVFRSELAPRNGRMTERFGPFVFDLDLTARDGALHFPVAGARIGPLQLPCKILPQSIATETDENGLLKFDVALHVPLTGGLIVHYRGLLAQASAQQPIDDNEG